MREVFRHCLVLFSPGSGLVMLQTTNSILNKTLYDLATSSSLLAWHRVRLANWLASSGEDWAEYVSQYNSGECERERGRWKGKEEGVGDDPG